MLQKTRHRLQVRTWAIVLLRLVMNRTVQTPRLDLDRIDPVRYRQTMAGRDSELKALKTLIRAIVAGDAPAAMRLLAVSPALLSARVVDGATRQAAREHFLDEIQHYVYAGDTALHVAAAAYQIEIVKKLVGLGSDVRAKNRRGAEPLHYAVDGGPGSPTWNPSAQAATVALLIQAGADPNAVDKSGVTPLHRAVRTRCAAAVSALLDGGADVRRTNKSGSTPMTLAIHNTGRSGSGSPEAKAQQAEIARLLQQHGATR
jgi:ankyrin repeat protein